MHKFCTDRFLTIILGGFLAVFMLLPGATDQQEQRLAFLPGSERNFPVGASSILLEPPPFQELSSTLPHLPSFETDQRFIKGELREGENLALLFKRLQVPENIRRQVVSGFSDFLDFNKLRPREAFSILLGAEGSLISCTYQISPFESYTLAKSATGWRVGKDTIPLLTHTVRISGTMSHGSLTEVFGEIGEDSRLARDFAEIFASLLDLESEAAEGDRFSLLVEKYYSGEQFIGYGNILMGRYEPAAGGVPLEAVYFEPGETMGGYFSRDGKNLTSSFLPSPVPSARVSSGFSRERQHPILGIVRPHLGIDLAAPEGTPILAAAAGRVAFMNYNGGFGKQIVLKHAGGVRTHYGHLSRYRAGLGTGDLVKQKDIIGYVGATGLATGPHLDYRVEFQGGFIDPFGEDFLNPVLAAAELFRLQLSAELYSIFLEPEENSSLVLLVREQNLVVGSTISLLQERWTGSSRL